MMESQSSPALQPAPEQDLDLLNVLSSGEDEFDVDLMACGCRVMAIPTLSEWAMIGMGLAMAAAGSFKLHKQLKATNNDIKDMVRLYELGDSELRHLIAEVSAEGGLGADRVVALANETAGSKSHSIGSSTIAGFVEGLGFDSSQLTQMLVAVINESGIEPKKVFAEAERCSTMAE